MSNQPYALLEIDSFQDKQPTNRNIVANIKIKCILLVLSIIIFAVGLIIGRFTIQCHCNCQITSSTTISYTSPPTITPFKAPNPAPTTSPTVLPSILPSVSPTSSPTTSPVSSTTQSKIQLAQSILSIIGLNNFTYLFNHKNDTYFDYTLNDSQTFGGKLTSTAKGWVKFGLNTKLKKINGSQVDISNWCRGYHGTELENIPKIFATNLTLLKAGDTIPGTNETLQHAPGHVDHPWNRFNYYTNEEEFFDPSQVFLSPSARYASNILYTPEHTSNISGELIAYKVILEAAIKNGFGIGQTTTPEYKCFDGVIENNQIEWYTKQNLQQVVLTGLLIKARKIDQWMPNTLGYISVNSAENTITRNGVHPHKLHIAWLNAVSSGYHEWLFLIKKFNETNRDGIIFGLHSEETHAYYMFRGNGYKSYTPDTFGNSPFGYLLHVNEKVRMIVDFYKYEVRFMINGYDLDRAFKLPEREISYFPSVWLGNPGDQIQLM